MVSEQAQQKSSCKKLEAGNFRFTKKRNRTIHVAKAKVLTSFAVGAKLIFVLVFAYEDFFFFSVILFGSMLPNLKGH